MLRNIDFTTFVVAVQRFPYIQSKLLYLHPLLNCVGLLIFNWLIKGSLNLYSFACVSTASLSSHPIVYKCAVLMTKGGIQCNIVSTYRNKWL
jgi:hypothetical protein